MYNLKTEYGYLKYQRRVHVGHRLHVWHVSSTLNSFIYSFCQETVLLCNHHLIIKLMGLVLSSFNYFILPLLAFLWPTLILNSDPHFCLPSGLFLSFPDQNFIWNSSYPVCVMCLAYFNIFDIITEINKFTARNRTSASYLGDSGLNLEDNYTDCDCS